VRINHLLLGGILAALGMCIGCVGANPITLDPNAPEISRLKFATRLVARLNPTAGEVWIGAPPGWSAAGSLVRFTVAGELTRKVRSLIDGSVLYRFPGDENSVTLVEWVDQVGVRHSENVPVTNASDDLDLHVGTAGLYPNRMIADEDAIWVVNSGNDELASYDLVSLQKGDAVKTPAYSNPWDAAFIEDTSRGLITTLFAGVHMFDASTGETREVSTDGFRTFASPNGVAILTDGARTVQSAPGTQSRPCGAGFPACRAVVVNPNPVSYFPTEFGQGWISWIELSDSPRVYKELNARWLNPQYVIEGSERIYVSCSGTIDFAPPDYVATALDAGGVMVISKESGEVVEAYELGLGGPGPMALSPDERYLYVGSGVAGRLFRIDLERGMVLNSAENPILVSDFPGTFISFLEVSEDGLLACASFNDDTIRFVDSMTGELDPFPFFEPVELHPDDPDALYGPQAAKYVDRGGVEGLLILTTVLSEFHWLAL